MNLLSVKQTARKLNISVSKTYELINSGDLPAYRIGGAIRVDEADLRSFLSARRVEGKRQQKPRPPRFKSRHV